MKAIAAAPLDKSAAALMADQAALVIAGMLFGGCDLGEAVTFVAEPSADDTNCRDQGSRSATGDAAGRPLRAA